MPSVRELPVDSAVDLVSSNRISRADVAVDQHRAWSPPTPSDAASRAHSQHGLRVHDVASIETAPNRTSSRSVLAYGAWRRIADTGGRIDRDRWQQRELPQQIVLQFGCLAVRPSR